MLNGNDLINTLTLVPGGMEALSHAWRSIDYYLMQPYPKHAFGPQQWPLDKGPIPTPLPYVKILVDEGAEFVFRGGSPQFTVTDAQANDLLAEIIKRNHLSTRWVSIAQRLGQIGTMAVKWSYDADNVDNPVRLSFLSVPEECRFWADPHDRTRLLMVRVQYPYRDPGDGKWYYFREEWTDDLWVTYKPKFAGEDNIQSAADLPNYSETLGDGDGWVVNDTAENPFGMIPVAIIKNRSVEGVLLGEGDCWRSYKLIDRIALTMHGEDRSNQFHSEPIPVAVNAELENDGPLLPGEPVSVKNQNTDGPSADLKLLEPHGSAREFSHRSMDRWQQLLYQQVGMSLVDPAAVTNKGNMTRAVFEMLYARTIATSNRKRSAWGEGGLGPMFSRLLTALNNVGGVQVGAIKAPSVDMPDVTVTWPDYFEATDDDLKAVTDRTISQVNGGVLNRDRAARRIAMREGHPPHEIEDIATEAANEDADRKRQASLARSAANDAPAPADKDEADPQIMTNGL